MPLLGNPNLARLIFARRNVLPPTAHYVTADDYLSVTFHTFDMFTTTLVVTTRARLLRPDGSIQIMVWPKELGVFDTFEQESYQLAEGCLLGVSVTPATQSIARGEVFATLELTKSRGIFGVKTGVLAADYLSLLSPVGWPGGRIISPLEGPGGDYYFRADAPGAGNVVLVSMPAFQRWRIKAIRVLFTTVGAANRQVFLRLRNSAFGPVWHAEVAISDVIQTAGLGWTYSFNVNGVNSAAAVLTSVQVALPTDMWLLGGQDLLLAAINQQAGDTFSASDWLVERALVESP